MNMLVSLCKFIKDRKMLTYILYSVLCCIAMLAAFVCIYVSMKSVQNSKKHLINIDRSFESFKETTIQEMNRNFDKIFFKLESIENQLRIIDSKTSDLNMRISIAEVRLEERKPQILLPGPSAPAKRGRKPKLK